VDFREHPLVQNSDYPDAVGDAPEKNDMTALFGTPKAGAYGIAAPPRRGILSQISAAHFEGVEAANRLFLSPCRSV